MRKGCLSLAYPLLNEPIIYRVSTVYLPCMYRKNTVVVGVMVETSPDPSFKGGERGIRGLR